MSASGTARSLVHHRRRGTTYVIELDPTTGEVVAAEGPMLYGELIGLSDLAAAPLPRLPPGA